MPWKCKAFRLTLWDFSDIYNDFVDNYRDEYGFEVYHKLYILCVQNKNNKKNQLSNNHLSQSQYLTVK